MQYTSNSTFTQDLQSSQQGETTLANKFIDNGWTATTTVDKGKFSGYDLEISRNGLELTIEFKHDSMVDVTGNVAVELFKCINNEIRDSGLSATTAEYYVYKLGVEEEFYAIKTSILRDHIQRSGSKYRYVTGGDGGRVHLVLIPAKDFKAINKVLFR